jgi:hypothetical protein
MMTRLVSWVLVLLLLGAFAGAVAYALWLRAAAGAGVPDYSVYSDDRDGLAEAAREFRRLGWEPVAVTRPIPSPHHRGLLVLVEPQRMSLLGTAYELPEGDARALLRWVEAGNTLLYCGRHATELHHELGVVLLADNSEAGRAQHTAEVGDVGLYTDEVSRMTVEGTNQLRVGRGLPLWWVEGRPAAVVVKHGKGRVILVADSSLLTWRGLQWDRGDTRKFIQNVAWLHARGGKVYFDEYHHGLQSGGGVWGYLAYHQGHWVLLSVVLLAAVAAWSVAVRLGPPRTAPEAARADAVDYASAVARIYQRAGARRLPARALVRGFLTALTRHLRLRRNALPAEILRAWQEQHPGRPAQRLQALLRGVTALRKGDASEEQLLDWSRAFDTFQAEMRRAR